MKKNAVVGQSGGPTAKPLRDCIRSIKPRRRDWHCLWDDKWN